MSHYVLGQVSGEVNSETVNMHKGFMEKIVEDKGEEAGERGRDIRLQHRFHVGRTEGRSRQE